MNDGGNHLRSGDQAAREGLVNVDGWIWEVDGSCCFADMVSQEILVFSIAFVSPLKLINGAANILH